MRIAIFVAENCHPFTFCFTQKESAIDGAICLEYSPRMSLDHKPSVDSKDKNNDEPAWFTLLKREKAQFAAYVALVVGTVVVTLPVANQIKKQMDAKDPQKIEAPKDQLPKDGEKLKESPEDQEN